MEFSHAPVMPDECISNLDIKEDGIYVDGTIGGGGHSSLICSRLSEKGTLIGIDRDMDALDASRKRLSEFKCTKHFVQSNYSGIKRVLEELGISGIDGALLDLGVSSFQLDNPERGFSYMNDAPLDMRMDQNSGFTAGDVVNTYSEKELAKIIRDYGEERWASRIAEFIVKARKEQRIETTGQLVDIIKAAIPASAISRISLPLYFRRSPTQQHRPTMIPVRPASGPRHPPKISGNNAATARTGILL
jgi:16S rRNA (cytosine1402-N4)-methyltransferase